MAPGSSEQRPLTVRSWPRFEHDLDAHIRHPDLDRETLLHLVEQLARHHPIHGFRDHALDSRVRNWAGFREFHLGPDLLVIYRRLRASLVLCRIGTHAELFGAGRG